MHWTSGASEAKDRSAAIEEAAAGLDADADLLVAFAAPELADAELSAALRARFPRARLVGATGAGVIGGGRE
ncbi:MAG TPA: FIST N-terminal domain-containing protein, partial [Polyangiaceae bacterium LLY-WYZ-15_(1-7)]|nr:FIST N-terminal domain-containing protein [Polyangiaceae bacterium LLY-WYZ-15_(1-7)]